MATSSLRFHCFVLAMIMVGAMWCGQHASAQTCNADISSLMSQCQKYVKKSGPKMTPSPGCCAAVKPVDVPCACAYVTKDIEAMVSMEKVVFVARSCGVKLTPGTKCGSTYLLI